MARGHLSLIQGSGVFKHIIQISYEREMQEIH